MLVGNKNENGIYYVYITVLHNTVDNIARRLFEYVVYGCVINKYISIDRSTTGGEGV